MEHPQNLIDKWLGFASLLHDEVAAALLGNFDERITSHVLDTCHITPVSSYAHSEGKG